MLGCDVIRDDNGNVEGALVTATSVAKDVVNDAEGLRNRLTRKPTLVGLTGGVARRFDGTEAYDFAAATIRLRGALGRLKALELASINNGDTLIGTRFDWQCRTLADSVATLDLNLSAKQLTQNFSTTEHYAKRVIKRLSLGGSDADNIR